MTSHVVQAVGVNSAMMTGLSALQTRQETFSAAYLAEDRGPELVAISIAFAVLTTITLALRFYAKRFQNGGFFADEVFLTLAYVVNLGMCAVGIVMVKVGGVGRHVTYVEEEEPEALVGWAKCILAFEFVYFTSVALPKLGIICLYLRVFNWRGAMRVTAWVVFTLTAMISVSLVIAACFQCIPLQYWWDRTIPGGSCFNVQSFFHGQALPGFIVDFVIMGLPVPTIWNLKLPLVKRLALVGVFVVASFGIVASIIRATIFFGTAAFGDRTWASVDLVGWSIIETSVYIITGCLPHLKPLISYYTPAWLKRALKSGLSSLPTKLTSRERSTNKSFGHSRRDQKSQTRIPDEDSIELATGWKGESANMKKFDVSIPSPNSQAWPHYPLEPGQQDTSRKVHIRSSSLQRTEETLEAGHITVTREIKMTRE